MVRKRHGRRISQLELWLETWSIGDAYVLIAWRVVLGKNNHGGYILPAFDRHNRHSADVRDKFLVLNVIAEQPGGEMCKHPC